jgi:hypothetical protein
MELIRKQLTYIVPEFIELTSVIQEQQKQGFELVEKHGREITIEGVVKYEITMVFVVV